MTGVGSGEGRIGETARGSGMDTLSISAYRAVSAPRLSPDPRTVFSKHRSPVSSNHEDNRFSFVSRTITAPMTTVAAATITGYHNPE